MRTLSSSAADLAPKTWINLATFNCPEDARELIEFLDDGAIVSDLQDERRLQKSWFLTRPLAGVHVRVPESSFAWAQKYVELNPAASRFLRKAVHCPSCNSTRVQYPQMTRKNLLPTLMAQLLVLLGVMNREYYCEACHYTWSPRRKNRVHF